MPDTKPGLRLVSWKPLVKNTLRGFCTVEFPFGLRIIDITIHIKGETIWLAMPGKAQLEQDGNTRRENGKVKYVKVVEWANKDELGKFRDRVIDLIRNEHPEAL